MLPLAAQSDCRHRTSKGRLDLDASAQVHLQRIDSANIEVAPVASEVRWDRLHGYVCGSVGPIAVDCFAFDEKLFDPLAFWILNLGIDIHSPAALHVTPHLRIRIGGKRSFQILLHHRPKLSACDLDRGNRGICRDDVPKIIASDWTWRNWGTISPAI